MVNKRQNLCGQVGFRDKGPAFEQLSYQNAQPDFDLIQPRTMARRIMHDDWVARIGQKRRSTRLCMEDSTAALDPQIIRDPRSRGHVPHQGFRTVSIQVVDHEMPLRHRRVARNDPVDVGQKIGFGAGRPQRRGHDLPGGNVPTQHGRHRAMADVLELTPLDHARRQRQARMFALQGLDPRQFIAADHRDALRRQRRCVRVQLADIRDLRVEIRISARGQPIADLVGFKIPFLSRRSTCRGEI